MCLNHSDGEEVMIHPPQEVCSLKVESSGVHDTLAIYVRDHGKSVYIFALAMAGRQLEPKILPLAPRGLCATWEADQRPKTGAPWHTAL